MFLLPHALEGAARAEPDREAIVVGDRSVTYGELGESVARFAGFLIERGLVRGDRVIVHASKSVESVIAMHGAQWAGGVAVPIDPSAPQHLVTEVVTDAEPFAIVTDARSNNLSADLDVAVRIDPAAWPEIGAADPVPIAGCLSDDPAYILYTSGSTGQPKGIVHSHRSGLRYAQLAASTYGLRPTDRLANVAPFHFDQSTFELYAGPLAGATVVLVPHLLLSFPAEVATLVEEQRITVWYSVPTLLVQLLERGALERFSFTALRWVLFGGEVFPSEALNALMSAMSSARFSNVYGPTEVNHCTHHHVDGPCRPDENVPIGRPWADTDVRLVDEAGAVLEGSATGVLEVRTATMMLGYWKRPDLTDAAIRNEVDAAGLGSRWYRTGDLVQREADGLLRFLGRIDRQVKIRGHRIELEGVEAALSNAPGVVRSAVIVDRQGPEPSLIGVVEGDAVDEVAVRAYVRSVLPPAAVPAELRVLAALPRTRSGKVDARSIEMMMNEELCQ